MNSHYKLTISGMAGVMLTAGLLTMALVELQAAKGGNGKGGGGNVGGDVSGWVFSKVTFDDRTIDGIEGDGGGVDGSYLDGEDRAEIRIGRNFGITMDFNTHKQKASLRKLHFPGGFPTPLAVSDPTCLPILGNADLTSPDANADQPSIALAAPDAELRMFGQDHDNTPVLCKRLVNARLIVKDDNAETWYVYFGRRVSGGGSEFAPCSDYMVVERLPDSELGKSRWSFSTDGVGYVYRDNNPPHSPTEFWGTVTLPMSGLIESLTNETAPTDCSTCNDYDDGDSSGCPTP